MWKDIEPFVGLVLTTAMLVYASANTKAHARAQNKEETSKRLKLSVLALVGLVVFAVLIVIADVPANLQRTHPDIIAKKIADRAICNAAMENFDFSGAEKAIRNNSLSKEKDKEYKQNHSSTIAHKITPLFNAMAFRTGALCSLLPVFVLLILHLVDKTMKQRPISSALGKYLPSEKDWSLVLLPLLNMVTAYGWIVNFAFHFWLREKQFTSCMLLSGHWYTFAHTLACFALAAVFFWSEKRTTYTYALISWLVLYAALALNVLKGSQLYHHDAEESAEGLKSFGYVVFFAAAAGLAILDNSLKVSKSGASIAKGMYAEVVVGHITTDGSENVNKGDYVQVLTDPDPEGWCECQIATADFKKGFAVTMRSGWVPAYCLLPAAASAPEEEVPVAIIPAEKKQVPIPAAGNEEKVADKKVEEKKKPAAETKSETKAETKAGGAARPVRPNALLAGIQGGIKLKKAKPKPAARPAAPMNAMLAALQGNAAKGKLRKSKPKPTQKPKPKPQGLAAQMEAAIAARRAKIKPPPNEDGDDDDEDAGWD